MAGVRLVLGRPQADDVPGEPFDLVHARLVVEHVGGREGALKRLAGWLRPGGWLAVEDVDWSGCAAVTESLEFDATLAAAPGRRRVRGLRPHVRTPRCSSGWASPRSGDSCVPSSPAAAPGWSGFQVEQAARLLATALGQDLTEGSDGVFRVARKVAPDRVISTVDPETRHGHKTRARGFDGYEGHIALDPDSEIITATEVTPGNSGDAEAAEDLLADILPAEAEADDSESGGAAAVYGDAAHGAGELLERLDNVDIHNGLKVQSAAAVKIGGRRPAAQMFGTAMYSKTEPSGCLATSRSPLGPADGPSMISPPASSISRTTGATSNTRMVAVRSV